jgi:hypothetical protein
MVSAGVALEAEKRRLAPQSIKAPDRLMLKLT